jgi:hypothetical protein
MIPHENCGSFESNNSCYFGSPEWTFGSLSSSQPVQLTSWSTYISQKKMMQEVLLSKTARILTWNHVLDAAISNTVFERKTSCKSGFSCWWVEETYVSLQRNPFMLEAAASDALFPVRIEFLKGRLLVSRNFHVGLNCILFQIAQFSWVEEAHVSLEQTICVSNRSI